MAKNKKSKKHVKKGCELREELRVVQERSVTLEDRHAQSIPCGLEKHETKKDMDAVHKHLDDLQEILYAEGKRSVLIVLQAMDTGGKDSTIRRVFGPLNPQGVGVTSFKQPTPDEAAHDFLWRVHRETPRKGMIRIFNRSHYEDVLVARVHQLADKAEIDRRYEQITSFEKHLSENGVTVLKFFLHISKEEQRERLQDRLDRPDKHWKFSSSDVAERKRWKQYMEAYEKAVRTCSTAWAPWYVVPADRKWCRDYAVGTILLATLEEMDLRYPDPDPGLADIATVE